jgi:hypothetical protein
MAMVFVSEGKISFEAAKRLAAKEIADRERQRKRALQGSPPSSDGVTVRGARAALLAKLNAIGERLRATAGVEERRPTPQIRAHTLDPEGFSRIRENPLAPSAPNKQPEPDRPVAEPVFVFGATSTSERIDDREFANSLRWGNTATDNWRKSIERNARIAREKEQRSRWIG